MLTTRWTRPLAVAMAAGLLAVGCTESDGGGSADGGDDPGGGTTTTSAPVDLAALGLWDDGACDDSLDPLVVGLQTVFESGVLSLEDQAIALEASATAFNARGGANGHCIEAVTCDDGADPNRALECVRTLDAAGVAVNINDTISVAGDDVIAAYQDAGIPRFAVSPNTDEYGDLNGYPFDGGGVGTTFMMPKSLLDAGVTKMAVVRVDVPEFSAFVSIIGDTYPEMEVVADIPVPAGTTDYSQFVIAAQDASAEGIMLPLGGQEAIQVLRAAQQLGVDLPIAVSFGTLPYADVAALGDFSSNLILNASTPPATFEDPVVDLIAADLAASGESSLQRENLKTSPMRSWIGLYALLSVIRTSGTEDFSRDGLRSVIEASGEIDMLGLTSDWTPVTDNPGAFPRSGNGFYSFWTWDPAASFGSEAGNFVRTGEANLVEELCGSPLGGPEGSC